MNTRERPPKAAVKCKSARNPRGEVDVGQAAQLLDGVHRAHRIVRVRDRSPEHGEQHDTLVAARALQHVAAELVDQVRRGGEEAAEIVELGGNETNTDVTCRCSSGGRRRTPRAAQ